MKKGIINHAQEPSNRNFFALNTNQFKMKDKILLTLY